MNIKHTLTEGYYAYSNLYLKKKDPVIVYASGRVGSMGLLKNLRDAGVYSFKVESFIDEDRGVTHFCKKHIIDAQKSVKVITLVRDPVEIMSSYFFSKSIKGWIPKATEAYRNNDVSTLQKLFITEILQTQRLDTHLYWYENDFNPSLGFDIFSHPFNTKNKHSSLKHHNFSVLIIRIDLEDSIKTNVVNNFLDTDNIKITRENVRAKRTGHVLYKEFKETLHIPPDILEKIYSAPYVTHFFSSTEQEALRKKWS